MGKGGLSVNGIGSSITDFNNTISGVNKQAKYAQSAAMAEQAQRQAVTREARAARDRMNLAAQSPQQLAALERSYQAAQTQVDTDLRQLAAIDPAIMEASKQVLSLLKGDQAASNNPLMAQRNSQRQQLLDSLRAQYGPGAESSAVGQRALRQFDMESNNMLQQNQMGTMGNLFGMATTRVQGAGFGQLMAAGQGFGDYQSRLLAAEQAGSQGILQAMGGEVQGAGAQFTGDLIKTGAQRQFFTDIHNDGRQIGRSWATFGQSSKGGGGSMGSATDSTSIGMQNSGNSGGYQLSNPGTNNSNFWQSNPYK